MAEPPSAMPEEFLTLEEFCARVQLDRSTVYKLRKTRGLPTHRWGHRTVRIEWGEALTWMEQMRGEENQCP